MISLMGSRLDGWAGGGYARCSERGGDLRDGARLAELLDEGELHLSYTKLERWTVPPTLESATHSSLCGPVAQMDRASVS